ncbi:MAG: chemotaxis protein CheW [Pseudomonadota bacterium]
MPPLEVVQSYLDALLDTVTPSEPETVVVEAPPAIDDGLPVYVLAAGGLTLALPQAAVAEVLSMPGDADPLPGPLAVGLAIHDEFPLWLADLAAMVLPAARHAVLPPAAERLTHALRLRGSEWALCVEAAPEKLVLKPDEIQPRGAGSTRPWLAGTVLARGLAVLDVAGLNALLAAANP